jgi:mycothiol synthase
VKLRPPRDGDFDAILEVVNAGGRAAYGEDEYGPAEFRTWLSSPKLNQETDIRLAEEDGRIVGYGDVDRQGEDPVRWWSDLKVHPDADVDGVIAELVAWAESRAEGGVLRAWNPSKIARVGSALERVGFRPIRHSFRMAIDVDNEVEPAEWPDRVIVRTFREGEGRTVYEAFQETWQDTLEPEDEPYEEWAHWTVEREDFDPSLWFLACEGDEIVGFSLCRPAETRPATGVVGLLGVRRPWRRRGVGEALLRHSFREFRERGFSRVALGVDADSPTGAPRLYERAGMHVVRRVDFYEKEVGAPPGNTAITSGPRSRGA